MIFWSSAISVTSTTWIWPSLEFFRIFRMGFISFPAKTPIHGTLPKAPLQTNHAQNPAGHKLHRVMQLFPKNLGNRSAIQTSGFVFSPGFFKWQRRCGDWITCYLQVLFRFNKTHWTSLLPKASSKGLQVFQSQAARRMWRSPSIKSNPRKHGWLRHSSTHRSSEKWWQIPRHHNFGQPLNCKPKNLVPKSGEKKLPITKTQNSRSATPNTPQSEILFGQFFCLVKLCNFTSKWSFHLKSPPWNNKKSQREESQPTSTIRGTCYGRNPAPVDMENIPLFTTSQMVNWIFPINSVTTCHRKS